MGADDAVDSRHPRCARTDAGSRPGGRRSRLGVSPDTAKRAGAGRLRQGERPNRSRAGCRCLYRITELERRNAGTKADLDRRSAQHAVGEANLLVATAAIGDANAAAEAAEAQVAQIEAQITEMTLRAPVSGRIEYKLVQPGAIVGPGARIATILDLSDVYMTVFLPTADAGRLALGSEARILLDAVPSTVIPATVSFVATKRSLFSCQCGPSPATPELP